MVQIYTSFGYHGVGTCRRIKDELIDLLEKEGKTWEQVVEEAVDKHSWKKPEPKPTTLDQLKTEAEELKSFLDLDENEKAKVEEVKEPAPQETKAGSDAELEGAARASVL